MYQCPTNYVENVDCISYVFLLTGTYSGAIYAKTGVIVLGAMALRIEGLLGAVGRLTKLKDHPRMSVQGMTCMQSFCESTACRLWTKFAFFSEEPGGNLPLCFPKSRNTCMIAI